MWVVGKVTTFQTVLHLTGLRGRSVTLGLQQGPALDITQQWGILDNELALDLVTLRE